MTASGFEKAFLLLRNDPGLFLKWVGKRAGERVLPPPRGIIQKRIRGVCFEFDFLYGPQIKKMYFGAYEIFVVQAMERFLKEGDIFIDAGASIGYLSAVGAGFVGKSGEVHSFEPSLRDFARLEKTSLLNPEYKIKVNRAALGEEKGSAVLEVSHLNWVGWNTLVAGYMREGMPRESQEVAVQRLDRYLEEHVSAPEKISLIKIDTEGFEFPILKGLEGYFEKYQCPVICEVNPRAYPLMGRRLEELVDYMKKYGYCSFSLLNFKKEINITKLEKTEDVLFLKKGAGHGES